MAAPVKRKLAAILAADAVGYSRHMAADEEGTLKILSAHRAVIDGIIEFQARRAAEATQAQPAQKVSIAPPRYADGLWAARFSCTAFESAPAQSFPARVSVSGNSFDLRMGQPDQPGSLRMTGVPDASGALQLSGNGISSIKAFYGKPYRASINGRLSSER
jgi:hypothetical protein